MLRMWFSVFNNCCMVHTYCYPSRHTGRVHSVFIYLFILCSVLKQSQHLEYHALNCPFFSVSSFAFRSQNMVGVPTSASDRYQRAHPTCSSYCCLCRISTRECTADGMKVVCAVCGARAASSSVTSLCKVYNPASIAPAPCAIALLQIGGGCEGHAGNQAPWAFYGVLVDACSWPKSSGVKNGACAYRRAKMQRIVVANCSVC